MPARRCVLLIVVLGAAVAVAEEPKTIGVWAVAPMYGVTV